MKLPRDLSGQLVVLGLCRDWGYRVVNQQGGHIILQTEEPKHQRLSVPDHAVLRIGTLSSILRAV
jgi:predicted RNA binding protein YcfA (HicA-like mRNA interferase family)